MRKYIPSICLVNILTLVLVACGGNKNSFFQAKAKAYHLEYARNIEIFTTPQCTLVNMRNPWDTTKTLHTYVLVPKNRPLPKDLPNGTIIRTPVSNALLYSSIHCSLLMQLGKLNSIGGVCDLKYIKIPYFSETCKEGKMVDAGDAMNPDIEKIIEMHPDLIMLSPFENSGGYGRIEELNVPIMECADYMESSPLARAEWMKFYGMLFGCEKKSDSLFVDIKNNYLSLCRLARKAKVKPKVLDGLKDGGTWYVSNAYSTTGHLFADAGMDYIFADRLKTGFDPLSFEQVFSKAQDADIWIMKYNQSVNKTYSDLQNDYTYYTKFKAYKQRRIYACNVGNVAFYEETTFHPDWLLQDLIVISHPELLPGKQLRFYKPLKD